MGKESFIKSGLKVASFMFVMAVVFVLSRNTAGMAAGKKVRVNTYDELVAAVDNSSVETILLNTKIIGTYKIQEMKNAKNKNLIINAPDIDIVNKAVWKSVEIEYVNSYKEIVSGNTLYVPAYLLYRLEIAKKVTLNKLCMIKYNGYEGEDFYFVLRKGAKIKEICYKNGAGKEFTMNKKSKDLTFEEEAFEWGEKTEVELEFDKNSRIINIKEMFESTRPTEYVIKYDKNGNVIESSGNEYEDGEVNWICNNSFTYDSKNRPVTVCYNHRYTPCAVNYEFRYNSKGRLVKKICTSEMYDQTIEYTYYKNGLVKKLVYTDDDHMGTTSKRTVVMKYNDKGLLTQEKETSTAEPGKYTLSTYKYDKNMNKTAYVYKNYDGEETTYDYGYDEYGYCTSYTETHSDGTVYNYDPKYAD